ncbi:MAG: polysaccharide deacetylase family protein [Bacteroidia bacterium]
MTSKLLIYTPKLTARVNYIFLLFWESIINTPYRVITDITEYKNYEGPRLNYSEQPVARDEIFVCSSGLLFDKGINPQKITVSEWEGLKVFYQTAGGSIPFDVFAASFYLVSRYEEYFPFEYDEHRRFRPSDSLAFKNKFINVPLVNLWAEKLKSILLKAYPGIAIRDNTYTFIPTIDVDVAYAHKGRKLHITIGSYLKALSKFNFALIADKTRTLLGQMPDEYDTYDYLEEILIRKSNTGPIYFFLAGNRAPYDKNIDFDSLCFANLVKKVSGYAGVGIHPSYKSMSKIEVVGEEVKRVERWLGKKITQSRQHFLRIIIPDTYRCLAALGITDDYSMGYASCPGFRASICTPFFFYDLQKEEILPVKLHPSVVMDGTLLEYMNISPDEAINLTGKLIEQVKHCKGEFVSIWHNSSLNDLGKWKGWRKVFETIVAKAK